MIKVIKYTTEQNECPLDIFIEELIKSGCLNDVRKIEAYIRLLEINGDLLLKNSTWAKKLNYKIYELRPKTNRILFFFYHENECILLHGFKKKTQKTPINEIEKAVSEANDYERRNGNGQ